LSVTGSPEYRHIRRRHSGSISPGEDNPADFQSRGVNADQLKGLDTWWRGLAWLSKSVEFWPRDADNTEWSPPEESKIPHSVLHILTTALLLDPTKYSSYWKLLRVMVWVFRFIRNIRRAHKLSGELRASELT